MTSKSKIKGTREESQIVKKLKENGIEASRVPLSGALGGEHSGDIKIKGFKRPFEVKLRANAFREIYKWIDDNEGLFIRSDRKPGLVVLPLDTFIRILNGRK